MVTDYKKRVGVIRGGDGSKYESSLKRGGEIILHILENLADKYKVVDILVDKDGIWHASGVSIKPADLVHKVDVVWNTINKPYLSVMLDNLSIPNVNNGSFLGTLENNSEVLRKHMKEIGVEMPRSILFPLYQKDFDGPEDIYINKKAQEVLQKFPAPWTVKSFTKDENMGIHLAKTFPELVNAIEDGVAHKKNILVEEFIVGKVLSSHSIPEFRNQDIYIFPFVNSFGTFSSIEKDKLNTLIKDLHRHLNAKHYLKLDLVLNGKGKIYLLNIESSPDLKLGSHFSQVCDSVGAKMHHVIEHLLEKK